VDSLLESGIGFYGGEAGPRIATWGKSTILSVDAHGFKFEYTLTVRLGFTPTDRAPCPGVAPRTTHIRPRETAHLCHKPRRTIRPHMSTVIGRLPSATAALQGDRQSSDTLDKPVGADPSTVWQANPNKRPWPNRGSERPRILLTRMTHSGRGQLRQR
jgi:hypothetical protein